MKKLQITFMIVLGSFFFTNGVIAQNKPLACQVEKAAGLDWVNGRWVAKTFDVNTPKFILVQAKDGLTRDSAAKALDTYPSEISCRSDSQFTCFDNLGASLYFDPKTLNGGISQLYGSIASGTKKDSVTVRVFSCTPF